MTHRRWSRTSWTRVRVSYEADLAFDFLEHFSQVSPVCTGCFGSFWQPVVTVDTSLELLWMALGCIS